MNDDPRQYVPQAPGPLFYIAWMVAVLAVLGTMAGLVVARDLQLRRQTATLREEVRQGPLVLVVPVARVSGQRIVTLPGEIHGYIETPVYAKVAGYLKTIKVDKGDRVAAGELLAVLESPELDHQVANAQADYELKAVTDRRNQELLRKDVLSRQAADESRAAMVASKATLGQLRALQRYEVIRAPFSGIVTARNADPGALIPEATAGSVNAAIPILSMATLSPLRVYVELPQSQAPFVKDGNPATVMTSEYPGREFKGAVTRHPTALANETRTMRAEIDLPNRDSALYPGMYVQVSMEIAGPLGAPQVPDDALIFHNGKVYVPTVASGHLRLREVSLGYDNGRTVEVTRGLVGDELVAMNVGQTAHDGEAVRALRADKPRK